MSKSYPNVILIVLDTARAANLSSYGYTRETTPRIDGIAERGMLFEQAISASPWTLPSHASMFTGLYPAVHGCHEKHKTLSPQLPVLPELLKDHGYHTVALSNNSWISKTFGFARGFDQFFHLWQLVQYETDLANPSAKGVDKYKNFLSLLRRGNVGINLLNGVYGKYFWRRYDYGARRINRLMSGLAPGKLKAGQPFFLFINYLEPHLFYKAPEPYFGRFLPRGVSRSEALAVNQDAWAYMGGVTPMGEEDFEILTALYDGELAYLDFRMGELYRTLEKCGLLDNTLLIITSDHGENLGEHGLMDHQYCLYDTLLRVPLVVKLPGAGDRAVRRSDVVQTVDILPTIFDVAGLPGPLPDVQGASLLNGRGDGCAFSEYLGPQPAMDAIHGRYPRGRFQGFDRSLSAVRSGEWKLIRASDGTDELYRISEDPGETANVLTMYPEVCADLKHKLQEWQSRAGGQENDGADAMGHVSDEIKQRLASLGYF